jgi:Protein of unknown function (DUF3168)
MNAALSLQQAMRAVLLARAPLTVLLGGSHIFDEVPRGANAPYVHCAAIETRDWSVAQAIAQEIETALDMMPMTMVDHKLVNLRILTTLVQRNSKTENFIGTLRFRAATEPN